MFTNTESIGQKYMVQFICITKFCNIRSNCEIVAQYFGDMMTQMWMFLRATARWQVDRSEVAWSVISEGNISNFLTSSQVGCFAAPEWVLTFNLKKYFDLKSQAIQQQQKWLQESDKTSRRSPRP